MAKSQSLTGKAGSLVLNGVQVAFKVISPDTEREYADDTDSSGYDQATDLVHKSQQKVSTQTEMEIEGNFDLNTTPAVQIAALYDGADAIPAAVNLKPGVPLLHGNFDLTKFSTKVAVTEIVPFTATLKSNGKVTWLS